MHKVIVCTFGRFNPPHAGHGKVVEEVYRLAKKLQGDACIFTSWKQDSKKNPLPFQEKVSFLRRLFPKMNFAANPRIKDAFSVVQELSQMGYTDVWVVVGEDQLNDFRKFERYVVHPRQLVQNVPRAGEPQIRPGAQDDKIILKRYEVVGIARPDSKVSATYMRERAVAGDWTTFRLGIPTSDDKLAREIYDSVRRHMGLHEQAFTAQWWICPYCGAKITTVFDMNALTGEIRKCMKCKRNVPFTPADTRPMYEHAILLYGATPADAQQLREAFHGVPNVMDVSRLTTAQVLREHARLEKAGRNIRVYVRESGLKRLPLTESTRIQRVTSTALIKEALARDVVVVQSSAKNLHKDVLEHIEKIFHVKLVAEGADWSIAWSHERAYYNPGRYQAGFEDAIAGRPRANKSGELAYSAGFEAGVAQKQRQGALDEAEAPKPKQPTDVDRIKIKQKQETLALKQRQDNDLLQAQKRELDKKSREDAQKIIAGTKPRDISR